MADSETPGTGTVKRDEVRPSWLPRGRSGPHSDLVVGLAIKNVAAVQLCSGPMLKPGEAGRYGETRMVFEMNLVVPGLPRERMQLVCNDRQAAMRTDARRLAEFLGVPLLDHTQAQD